MKTVNNLVSAMEAWMSESCRPAAVTDQARQSRGL